MAKRSTVQLSGQAMLFNFLLNELLASQLTETTTFWVMSPWVTNFRLPAPYAVSFGTLVNTREEQLQLFDVLYHMALNGREVKIVVGGDTTYHQPLKQFALRHERLQVRQLPELHAKAYVGRYGALFGSLNMTRGGVAQNIELYEYYHDQRNIIELRRQCRERFEEALDL